MKNKEKQPIEPVASKLYISIDHLKEGMYQLHLTCKEKIVKTINFKK
jgi:hypothetical protein